MAESPLENPLGHSTDGDVFHFPNESAFNVYDWTHKFLGDAFTFLGIGGLSKYMALEVVAVGLLLLVAVFAARQISKRGYARGVFANFFESMLLFIRDQVAVPAIGEHDANKHLPYLWTLFLFILVNNLLGMIPNLGSPTGALGCTGALAFSTFIYIHLSGIKKMGFGEYAHAFVPHVPKALFPLMLLIELVGHIIKPCVLAVRLFVNMLAGHTVLYVIMGFIVMVGPGTLYFIVGPASVVGNLLLSFLELFVAFLQAYVFTFLSAIFIGAAIHPQH